MLYFVITLLLRSNCDWLLSSIQYLELILNLSSILGILINVILTLNSLNSAEQNKNSLKSSDEKFLFTKQLNIIKNDS